MWFIYKDTAAYKGLIKSYPNKGLVYVSMRYLPSVWPVSKIVIVVITIPTKRRKMITLIMSKWEILTQVCIRTNCSGNSSGFLEPGCIQSSSLTRHVSPINLVERKLGKHSTRWVGIIKKLLMTWCCRSHLLLSFFLFNRFATYCVIKMLLC